MDEKFQFTDEFKRNAVQLLLLKAKSMAQIEEQFKIPPGLLSMWLKELAADSDKDQLRSVAFNVQRVINDQNKTDQ